MSKCKECKNKNKSTHICDECIDGEMFERKITTQADKIRFMNDEELAEFLNTYDEDSIYSEFCEKICDKRNGNRPVINDDGICPISDKDSIKEWLQCEVSECNKNYFYQLSNY